MEIKKALIWCVLNNENTHPALTRNEEKIEGYMPLISALFPRIKYTSLNGFDQIISSCVRPVLGKLFPDLLDIESSAVDEKTVTVTEFLTSDGNEWGTEAWQTRLEARICS